MTPSILYHYTGVHAFQSIVTSGILYATDRRYLSDKSEFRHALRLFREAIREKALGDPARQEFYPQLEQCREDIERRSLFVASFSEAEDSLSQWRSYCPSGGYAIGFSFDELRKRAQAGQPPASFELRKCLYDDDEKRKEVDRVLVAALHEVDTDEQIREYYISAMMSKIEPAMDRRTNARRMLLRDGAALAAISKHSAFSDEREWRLVSMPLWDGPARAKHVDYQPQGSWLVPYMKIQTRGDGDPLAVVEVRVGPMRRQKLAHASAADLLEQFGLDRGKVIRSDIPYRAP